MIVEMVMRRIEVHMATQMAERSSSRDGEAWQETSVVVISMVSMAEVDIKVDRLRWACPRKAFPICQACLVRRQECLLLIRTILWLLYLRCRRWDFLSLVCRVFHRFLHRAKVLPHRRRSNAAETTIRRDSAREEIHVCLSTGKIRYTSHLE